MQRYFQYYETGDFCLKTNFKINLKNNRSFLLNNLEATKIVELFVELLKNHKH